MSNPAPIHAVGEEEELRLAGEAERLMQHPLLLNALIAIEHIWMREWQMTKPDEPEKREEAYRMLRCGVAFRKLLTKYVTDGKLAAEARDIRTRQEALMENPELE